MLICTPEVKLNWVSLECGRAGCSPLDGIFLAGDEEGKKTAELLNLKEGLIEMKYELV